jgi:KDO2-lipid IV(A) lauroyltransferase
MTGALRLFSYLPFFILHAFSRLVFVVLYYGLGYRRKVVRENLQKSFPEKSLRDIKSIERKFYRNFCDLMIETIKSTSITREELLKRCHFTGKANADRWFSEGVNLNGLSSHLANWEWLGFTMCIETKQDCLAVYKPLSDPKMDSFLLKTRARLGLRLISMQNLRAFFQETHARPFLLGLLSDQAPHDYEKAFVIHYFAGPGVLTVKHDLTPCWGWMKRSGRSRFVWGLEPVNPNLNEALTRDEQDQIDRVARSLELTPADSERAYRIVKEYSRLLEERIKMNPEDWLWSHRRWKIRS